MEALEKRIQPMPAKWNPSFLVIYCFDSTDFTLRYNNDSFGYWTNLVISCIMDKNVSCLNQDKNVKVKYALTDMEEELSHLWEWFWNVTKQGLIYICSCDFYCKTRNVPVCQKLPYLSGQTATVSNWDQTLRGLFQKIHSKVSKICHYKIQWQSTSRVDISDRCLWKLAQVTYSPKGKPSKFSPRFTNLGSQMFCLVLWFKMRIRIFVTIFSSLRLLYLFISAVRNISWWMLQQLLLCKQFTLSFRTLIKKLDSHIYFPPIINAN